jgi:hypothetical protein
VQLSGGQEKDRGRWRKTKFRKNRIALDGTERIDSHNF